MRPVGSHESHDVDVRVIAATHRKLEERIASGEFREDLYYRLNVVKLYIPTLAERREDIPLLANHFLSRLAERYRKSRLALAPEAMQLLVSAPWPGNVRQLLNVIEQAVALAPTEVIPESLVRQALDAADTHAHAAGRGAQGVRARLPGAHPEDHRRQRHQGRAPGRAQSHRVLSPPGTPFA